MSSLRILFFGKLVDQFGRGFEIEWKKQRGTVGEVRQQLAELYPQAREALLAPSARACIGDTLVDDAAAVGQGDTIEFFPPVSGG